MKKIGVLTFHRAINYGAVLQTYGLCEAIKQIGADAIVIDYRCAFIENYYYHMWSRSNSIKENVKSLLFWKKQNKRNLGFIEFVNNRIKCTEPVYPLSEGLKNLKMDAYVVGSDQVWNYYCTAGDRAYLLDFVEDSPKYSYAASLGKMSQQQIEHMQFKHYLSDFKGISVREQAAKDLLDGMMEKDITILPDPTVLIERKEWSRIAEPVKKDKYVFVYSVNMPEEVFETAKEAAAKAGLELVAVTLNNKFRVRGASDLSACSPEEFLGLIENAEYIVTNSFHGTIFSIIFEKKFITVLNDKKGLDNSRMLTLLDRTGLTQRASHSIDTLFAEIDYKDIASRLELWRQEGMNYLKSVVEEKE